MAKAMTSLQILTESFWMLLLQVYITIHTWESYYKVPIGGLADIGKKNLITWFNKQF